jgi:hypothetical protein
VRFDLSDRLYRVASGRSNSARLAGLCFFVLCVLLAPFLYSAFLKAFASKASVAFAHLLSAVGCAAWLVFSNGIRKFTNGERLISTFKSIDPVIRTLGNSSKHTFARWSEAAFALLALGGIGWFAYAAWAR